MPENQSTQTDITPITDDVAVRPLHPEIIYNSNFRQTLAQIPVIVDETKKLLKMDINTIDEDDLDARLKQLRETQKFKNNVISARKEVKKYFDGVRDQALAELDQYLDGARFDELTNADAEIRKLKQDVLANRANHRWNELKPTFDANIQQYPIIAELAPALTDFSRFRITHSRLITGAKSGKVTDKQRTVVNQTVFEWQANLTDIKTNSVGLSPRYQFELLKDFIKEPTTETIHNRQQYYVNRQKAEDLARTQAEAAKKAEEERRKHQAQTSTTSKPADPTQSPLNHLANPSQPMTETIPNMPAAPRPRATEGFPWLVDYIFRNSKYKSIHGNNRIKAGLLYDLFHQLDVKNSLFTTETRQDPNLIMAVVRYVEKL